MKVLFVSSAYPNENLPQYCIFLEQQAQALKDLGYHIDILIPCPIEEFDINTSVFESTIYNGIKVYKQPYQVKSLKGLFVLSDARFVLNMKKLLLINNYDIVSIHYLLIDSVLKMCLKACNHCEIKTVVHFLGLNVWKDYYHPHPMLQKYHAHRRKRILSKADCLVGVCNKVSDIIKSKIDNKPVYTVYNGVDTKKFISSNSYKNPNIFRIICVANLIPIKGYQYLINACYKLQKEGFHIELIIVGRGSHEKKLKEKVVLLGAEKYIHFLGYIRYEQIVCELDKSDVFAMPSFFEAFACAHLEAMAMKLPIIGVKGQGIDEIIIDGKNGFLVEPKSSSSIYDKLRWIYNNRSESKQIGLAGYDTVINNYQWSDSAKMLDKVYRETVLWLRN
ncbi:MAG: glycosyltransferase family 4 protein [Mobilitalea sp.]